MSERRALAEKVPIIGESEDASVLEVLVDNLRDVLYVRDPRAGRMLFVNPAFEEVWGIPRQRLYDEPRVFVEAIVPEDRPKVFAALEAQDLHEVPFELEYRIKNASGEVRNIFARSFLVRRDGVVERVVGVAWDLTARRRVEDELRELQRSLVEQIDARTAELKRSLEEKEVLLRELNHRVKNNLQLVSSLLRLQADRTTDPATRAVLDGSRARVHAIALAHQHLRDAEEASEVKLDGYAQTITHDVAVSHGLPAIALTTRFATGDQRLAIDRAVPFGLALNELLTNAYRHAFPDGIGALSVSLSRAAGEEIVLEVVDDGAGFDVEGAERSASLGLRLVRTLVSQLGGTFEIERAHSGLLARVRFGIRTGGAGAAR